MPSAEEVRLRDLPMVYSTGRLYPMQFGLVGAALPRAPRLRNEQDLDIRLQSLYPHRHIEPKAMEPVVSIISLLGDCLTVGCAGWVRHWPSASHAAV